MSFLPTAYRWIFSIGMCSIDHTVTVFVLIRPQVHDCEDGWLYARSSRKSSSGPCHGRGIETRRRRYRPVSGGGGEELAEVWSMFRIEVCAHCFHSRYALQLLTPASISAQLAGRTQTELEDISEMIELFLDAKTSASNLAEGERV